ncbi:unnamed protein product [Nippostrongylus brasiliensis]|uniref:DUF1758 domain-containing protein n=1 Tax=Nippostrongylus brasiliensis TaxID=27835 RepID=A0A0N4YFT0_NIPBR|nr:unnamed protein product [Nippostrongylus brasiliensis]
MSKQLASHERLITIYRNKLEKVVASFKEDKLDALKTSESDRTPGFEKECRKKLQEGLGALEECSSRIEQAWQKYAEAYDQHDEPTETEKEDYNTYTERAEKALSTALDYTISHKSQEKSATESQESTSRWASNQAKQAQKATVCHCKEQVETKRKELASPKEPTTFLPTGEVTVVNPVTRELKKVPVLLDSGAESSFIEEELADELQLPTINMNKLRLRTFGSDQVQECISRKVPSEIQGENGEPYFVELLTHTILTSALKTPPVLEKDIEFMRTLEVPYKHEAGTANDKTIDFTRL